MKPDNNPDITAHEFLLNVMHDAALDLPTRMKAAEELMRLGLGHIGTIRTIKIKIEGGIPECPSFESRPAVDQTVLRGWNIGRVFGRHARQAKDQTMSSEA